MKKLDNCWCRTNILRKFFIVDTCHALIAITILPNVIICVMLDCLIVWISRLRVTDQDSDEGLRRFHVVCLNHVHVVNTSVAQLLAGAGPYRMCGFIEVQFWNMRNSKVVHVREFFVGVWIRSLGLWHREPYYGHIFFIISQNVAICPKTFSINSHH